VSKFKVGDKVVGFDGEEGFEGVVRNIGKDEVNIGNNMISRWFLNNYVYPSGTTIEIKEPNRGKGGGVMTISELQKQAHEIAKSKGWWDRERSWEEIVCLIHSEISEAFEEYRAGRMEVYRVPEVKTGGIVTYPKPEGFPIELADIVIRLMDWAEHDGIDIAGNWQRETIKESVDHCSLEEGIGVPYQLMRLHSISFDEEIMYPDNLQYCFDLVCILARSLDIDLEAAILTKMEYNRGRSYRHGGKKA